MTDDSNKAAPEPGVTPPAPTPPPVQKAPDPRKPGGRSKTAAIVDTLFYLILLGSIGFIGFMVYEQDKAMAVLFEQQNGLASQRSDTLNTVNSRFTETQAALQDMQAAVASAREEAANLVAMQAAEIERLRNELVSTRLRINSTNPGANQAWLLAEAASLLRLARQHLVVARDMRTAQALYIAADDILKRIDDPAIFSVREILAGELASIRAVAEVDVSSLYLQLGAIADQAGSLRVTNDLAAQVAAGEQVPLANGGQPEATGWWRGFFTRVRNTFSNYFVVRRRDVPIQPLMTPGQEAALMQTIRLQIEQGRTALLKGEQEIYTAGLAQARDNIDKYLAGDARDSVLAALDNLVARRIVTEVPTLNRALPALEQLLTVQEPAGIQ